MLNPSHDRSMSSVIWLLRSMPMFSEQLRDLSRSTCLMPSTRFRSIPCRTVDMFGGDFRRADERRFRENKPRDELRPLLRKWEGRSALKRDKAAPHIKTFFRYRETRENGECRSLALSPYDWWVIIRLLASLTWAVIAWLGGFCPILTRGLMQVPLLCVSLSLSLHNRGSPS